MSIKDRLIKVGQRHPDLRENIRPVLDHLSDDEASTFKEGSVGRRLPELIQGNKIFTVKEGVGRILMDGLTENGLYPRFGNITLKHTDRIQVNLPCKAGADFIDDAEDRHVQYIAEKAAADCKRRGYRVHGDGEVRGDMFGSTDAVVRFWQKRK
jgi:hypothetical protein